MDLHETLLERQTVFEGRLLTLHQDTVRLPDGQTALREVVAHPGAVAVVPYWDDERIVLVRQYRHAVGEVLLEVPAGILHPDESPEACARRELREETGYEAGRMEHWTSFYPAPGYSTERITVFRAADLRPAAGATDADEFLEVVIVPLRSAVAAIADGTIRDAKSIAALLWAAYLTPSSAR